MGEKEKNDKQGLTKLENIALHLNVASFIILMIMTYIVIFSMAIRI